MRNLRIIGAVAAVLLVGAVLVPVLVDRAGRSGPGSAGSPSPQPSFVVRTAEVKRLPTASPPTTTALPPVSVSPGPDSRAKPSGPGPRSPKTIGDITLPGRRPPALPARDVPPAVLAYSVDCADTTKVCWSWRLLDWKGRHWTLPRGTAVALAPNGRRIGYFRPDGSFVLRDLESGAVDVPLHVPAGALDNLTPRVTWTPNGRWLTIDYEVRVGAPGGTEPRRAILVDTTTMRTRLLAIACCVAGLHPLHDWLLTYDLYGADPATFQLVDPESGSTVRSVRPRGVDDLRWSHGRTGYPLAPDGRRFAVFLWDREAGHHAFGLVDAGTGAVDQHRLDGEAEGLTFGDLLGWPDGRTIAFSTEGGGAVMTYDVLTRKIGDGYLFSGPVHRLEIAVGLVRAE